jgi:ribonucleoside-diphosphate reductase alpha chain
MTTHRAALQHVPLGAICQRMLRAVRAVFMRARQRLPNRRDSVSLSFEVNGLAYTATYSRFDDGRVAEVFLQNHRTNSGADVNARDAAIAASFALQYGARVEDIRKALCRDSQGHASGPLGAALDRIAGEGDSP